MEVVVVRRGQIQTVGWVIKIFEAQVGQFLLGGKCPMRKCNVVQEQDKLGELPAAFLHSKCPSIAAETMSNTPR